MSIVVLAMICSLESLSAALSLRMTREKSSSRIIASPISSQTAWVDRAGSDESVEHKCEWWTMRDKVGRTGRPVSVAKEDLESDSLPRELSRGDLEREDARF